MRRKLKFKSKKKKKFRRKSIKLPNTVNLKSTESLRETNLFHKELRLSSLTENWVFLSFSLTHNLVKWILLHTQLNNKKSKLTQVNFSNLHFHGIKDNNTTSILMNYIVSSAKIKWWKSPSKQKFKKSPKEFQWKELCKSLYWQKIMHFIRFTSMIRKSFDWLIFITFAIFKKFNGRYINLH